MFPSLPSLLLERVPGTQVDNRFSPKSIQVKSTLYHQLTFHLLHLQLMREKHEGNNERNEKVQFDERLGTRDGIRNG
jgi:hypothetical protein